MKILITVCTFCFLICSNGIGQKKQMTLETYDEWKSISDVNLSSDGKWISYDLSVEDADKQLMLYNTSTGKTISFNRASNAQFDYSNNYFVFYIKAAKDTIDHLKRKKTKSKDLPKDTLGIFSLKEYRYDKFARIESYKMPKETGGLIAFKFHPSEEKDSTSLKKESKDNGSSLMVYNMNNDAVKMHSYVKNYEWSERNGQLILHTTGRDSINSDSIILIDTQKYLEKTILAKSAHFQKFNFNKNGDMLCFLSSEDKSDDRIDEIYHWNNNMDSATVLADSSAQWLGDKFVLSPYFSPFYSENDSRLYFGISKKLNKPDSLLLDSEKVELEIWNYQDDYLYPQQNINLKRDKEKSYPIAYLIESEKFIELANDESHNYYLSEKYNSNYFLSTHSKKYGKLTSWENNNYKDIYLTDLQSGKKELIAEKIEGNPRMSPSEKFIYWYSKIDTSWIAFNIEKRNKVVLSSGSFYDEINDRPMHPSASGLMRWTMNDEYVLLYDHYDIWKINSSTGIKLRLTKGREKLERYRYISLDNEIDKLPTDTTVLVRIFDEKDKTSGYAFLNIADGNVELIEKGPFNYSSKVRKAEKSNLLVFTKESFTLFPDLIITDLSFSNQKKITNANPQQKEYYWGNIELFKWKDNSGNSLEGLLVKPEGFDPSKKYPLIINFYERNSHNLFNHREPYPHRSTINYSYWANKGYVIFNPDIHYSIGYPGLSCYNAVMSGVEALLKEGFIDSSKMGLQGHSWGGYQIADLITRTNAFACAEAGAPVVNMTSAYGGIRWGSGRSRMFQYEQTQSRIGATLWEDHDLYIENSPLFNTPNVKTPVLILHNDHDGAVPWYQGIEYFVALRRLSKPAWMLNYVDEPHWPLKRQNRLDFNKRLEQFFDHYLMGQEMPDWMSKGVPAIEKTTNDGLGFSK